MTKEELIPFIREYILKYLKIKVIDAGSPPTCGGDCAGNYGVKVELWLDDPLQQIDWDKADLSY